MHASCLLSIDAPAGPLNAESPDTLVAVTHFFGTTSTHDPRSFLSDAQVSPSYFGSTGPALRVRRPQPPLRLLALPRTESLDLRLTMPFSHLAIRASAPPSLAPP